MQPNPFGNAQDNWRATLAQFNPAMANCPLSQSAAHLLASHGKNEAALAVFKELLEIYPDDKALLSTTAQHLLKMRRLDEAIAYRRHAGEIEVAERGVPEESREEVIEYLLAKEGYKEKPEQAPKGYVSNLFDDYAEKFEEDLVRNLRYRGPEATYEAVAKLPSFQLNDINVLDLGCGTGLVGQLFRQHAKRLVGIDISPKMVEQARSKNVYDQLEVGDIVEKLESMATKFDLIVATDVFVYVGELEQALSSCSHSLIPAGRLVFSVEEITDVDGPEIMLCGSGRYKHSQEYLRSRLASAGFESIELQPTVLRHENEQPVSSLICTARRRDLES